MGKHTYILKEPFEIYKGFTPDDEPEIWIWRYKGKKLNALPDCGKSPSREQAMADARTWVEKQLNIRREMNDLVRACNPTIHGRY